MSFLVGLEMLFLDLVRIGWALRFSVWVLVVVVAVAVGSGAGLLVMLFVGGGGGEGGLFCWWLCVSSRDVPVELCSVPISLPCSAGAEVDDVEVCEDWW